MSGPSFLHVFDQIKSLYLSGDSNFPFARLSVTNSGVTKSIPAGHSKSSKFCPSFLAISRFPTVMVATTKVGWLLTSLLTLAPAAFALKRAKFEFDGDSQLQGDQCRIGLSRYLSEQKKLTDNKAQDKSSKPRRRCRVHRANAAYFSIACFICLRSQKTKFCPAMKEPPWVSCCRPQPLRCFPSGLC